MKLHGWVQLQSTRRYISAEVSFPSIIHWVIRNTVSNVLWHLLSHLRSITTQEKKKSVSGNRKQAWRCRDHTESRTQSQDETVFQTQSHYSNTVPTILLGWWKSNHICIYIYMFAITFRSHDYFCTNLIGSSPIFLSPRITESNQNPLVNGAWCSFCLIRDMSPRKMVRIEYF